jgi:hypothetical protein
MYRLHCLLPLRCGRLGLGIPVDVPWPNHDASCPGVEKVLAGASLQSVVLDTSEGVSDDGGLGVSRICAFWLINLRVRTSGESGLLLEAIAS